MSNGPISVPDGFGVRTGSDLIVPAHVLTDRGASKDDAAASDADGRRRVVVTDDERRLIKRALDVLKARGFSVLFRCDQARRTGRVGVPEPCGELLVPEGQDSHDRGFGCRCSRIHLGS